MILVGSYFGYLFVARTLGELTWAQMMPMQMCDWALDVVVIALWTKRPRCGSRSLASGAWAALAGGADPKSARSLPSPALPRVLRRARRDYCRRHCGPTRFRRARVRLVGSLFRHYAGGRSSYRRELRLPPAQTGSVFAPQSAFRFMAALSSRCTCRRSSFLQSFTFPSRSSTWWRNAKPGSGPAPSPDRTQRSSRNAKEGKFQVPLRSLTTVA